MHPADLRHAPFQFTPRQDRRSHRTPRRHVALAVLALTTVVATPVAASQSAGVHGRVVDETGHALPGVTVQLRRTGAMAWTLAMTDTEGRYWIDGLVPDRYEAIFSATNFAESRRTGVLVEPGRATALDVTLYLSVNASVVVTARDTFRNLADLEHPEENLVGVARAASEGAVTAGQIEARPIMRAGEVLEAVPGVIISQHSGDGKANQYYLRGFNLDHGTDFSTTVAGLPVNLPTHGHGQGYADLNFIIPELVTGVQFEKGPYDAEQGDFSSAGAAIVNYANRLDRPLLSASAGAQGWGRVLAAVSPELGRGVFLAALELNHNDGPWVRADDYRKVNGVIRYTRAIGAHAFSLTGLGYASRWNATDQVPKRAVEAGLITRFGLLDSSDGGNTSRYSVVADYQHGSASAQTRVTGFASRYRLNLFSNFTYFLDDPIRGDQFEQADRRWVAGARVTHRQQVRWGTWRGENAVGAAVRHDDIPVVGLYRTESRQRIATVREDAVRETSVGLFATNEMRWLPWLRTTAGVRLDGYRFDVRAGDARNGGLRRAGMLSPKAGIVLGPWKKTEIYVNAGTGFHSNDARGTTIARDPETGDPAGAVTPVVRTRGAEIGIRSVALPGVQTTVTLWRLDVDSELLFVGDAGTTEPSRPTRRFGVEWASYMRLSRAVTADIDVALSHARFTDWDPAGDRIPGAAGTIASLGLTADAGGPLFGSLRWRYFGPRPLVEADIVRSAPTGLVNAQAGWRVSRRLRLILDGFNLLDARASDVDYFYTSRLPGEPAEGIDDVHTHPALPRTMRVGVRIDF